MSPPACLEKPALGIDSTFSLTPPCHACQWSGKYFFHYNLAELAFKVFLSDRVRRRSTLLSVDNRKTPSEHPPESLKKPGATVRVSARGQIEELSRPGCRILTEQGDGFPSYSKKDATEFTGSHIHTNVNAKQLTGVALMLMAAAGGPAAAQTWDTSGNGQLTGTYYFREVV